jgi:Na+/H+-dicarboxylate symporter
LSPALAAFALALLVTVALLALVVATGLRAQRRRHIPLVASTLVALVVTILLAERLGREYDLDAAGPIKPIHLTLAKIAALAYLLPIATGIRTLYAARARRWHRRAAFLALGLTLAALVTGTAMLLLAPPAAGAQVSGL